MKRLILVVICFVSGLHAMNPEDNEKADSIERREEWKMQIREKACLLRIKYSLIQVVRKEAEPSILNDCIPEKFGTLYFLLGHGMNEMAEHLLQKGADVNFKDSLGLCPLDGANSIASIQLLLKYGAKIQEYEGSLLERIFTSYACKRINGENASLDDTLKAMDFLLSNGESINKSWVGIHPFNYIVPPLVNEDEQKKIHTFLQSRGLKSELLHSHKI